MALAPTQLVSTPFEDYAGYWLKFYTQGTTTPITMATDSGGGTTVAKAEISSGGTVPIGFIKTTGDAIFIPYVDEAYDAWLFSTEALADANDTSSPAVQIADNESFLQNFATDTGVSRTFATVALMVASTDLTVGDIVYVTDYSVDGDGGGNTFEIVTAGTGTADGGSFIDLATHQAKGLFPGGIINVKQFGAANDSDGTTGDGSENSSEFAAAKNFAPDGGTVFIPDGAQAYRLTSSVDSSTKRMRWVGFGRASHVFLDNAAGAVNMFNSANINGDGLMVENIKASGLRTSGTDNEFDGQVVGSYNTADATFIRDSGLRHCYIDQMGGGGYFEKCDGAIVEGNRLENVPLGSVNAGVCSFWNCRASRIINNIQEDGGGANAILLNDRTATTTGEAILITGNRLLQEVSLRYHRDVKVTNNRIDYTNRDAFGGALLVTNGMEEVFIAYNWARGGDGNAAGTGDEGGVFRITDGAQHIIVIGNDIHSYGGIGDGMSLNGVTATEPIVIIGNTVIDESVTSVKNGIYLQVGADGISYEAIFSNNTVEGFTNSIVINPRVKLAIVTGNHSRSPVIRSILYSASGGGSAGDGECVITNNMCDKRIEVDNCSKGLVANNNTPRILAGNDSNYVAIDGNHVRVDGTTDPNIQVEGTDCDVKNNILIATGAGSTGGSVAINYTSTADGGACVGNSIYGLSQANAVAIKIQCTTGFGVLLNSNKTHSCWRGIEVVTGALYNTGGGNMIHAGAGGATLLTGAVTTGVMF